MQVPAPVAKLTGQFRRFREFLHEVRVELRQVTWPTRTDVQATTTVVIVTVFFFGVFLYIVDQAASRFMDIVLSFRR